MEILENDTSPQSYSDWANMVGEITGGELEEESMVVSSNEPLVRGVETPDGFLSDFGRKVNVRVLGDSDLGYTIRIRGRWPFSGSQLTYHIAPRGEDKVLLAAEKTKSKSFIFKPGKYEDDFTPRPKDESFIDVIPELDSSQEELLAQVLKNTAVVSAKKGLNSPNGDF